MPHWPNKHAGNNINSYITTLCRTGYQHAVIPFKQKCPQIIWVTVQVNKLWHCSWGKQQPKRLYTTISHNCLGWAGLCLSINTFFRTPNYKPFIQQGLRYSWKKLSNDNWNYLVRAPVLWSHHYPKKAITNIWHMMHDVWHNGHLKGCTSTSQIDICGKAMNRVVSAHIHLKKAHV